MIYRDFLKIYPVGIEFFSFVLTGLCLVDPFLFPGLCPGLLSVYPYGMKNK
jgi:hypothetical protein